MQALCMLIQFHVNFVYVDLEDADFLVSSIPFGFSPLSASC